MTVFKTRCIAVRLAAFRRKRKRIHIDVARITATVAMDNHALRSIVTRTRAMSARLSGGNIRANCWTRAEPKRKQPLDDMTQLGQNPPMQSPGSEIRLEQLSASAFAAAQDDLVKLLQACVHGGASLGFLAPLPDSEAIEYWRALGPQIQSGGRTVIVAREGAEGRIVGSGQVVFGSNSN